MVGLSSPAARRLLAVVSATAAVASGVLVGLSAPAAAQTAAACVPDGDVYVDIRVPELVPTGAVSLTLAAVDSCDAPVRGFTGQVLVRPEYLDESTADDVLVRFTAAGAGVAQASVTLPDDGLVYLYALDPGEGDLRGGTTVLAHAASLAPVVQDLLVTTGDGVYAASGVAANPARLDRPVVVDIVVDGVVASTSTASTRSDVWADAPPSVGRDRAFAAEVTLAPGPRTVCLELDGVEVDCRTATGAPPPPFGAYDGVFRVPAGIVAAGWAIDPGFPYGNASVQVTTDLRLPGTTAWLPGRAVTVPAQRPRRDVGAAFPQWGPAHGFVSSGQGTEDGTEVRVCVEVDGEVALGCRTTVLRRSPVGALDEATPVPGGIDVRGWALDQDLLAATDVHLYVDGVLQETLLADGYRADLQAVLAGGAGGLVAGYGGERGYETFLATPPGRRTLCAYGINLEEALGGSNSLLGCRTVVVPSADPVGRLDGATPAPGGFTLRGWAADPDAPTTPLQVHTYRDGTGAAITTADRPRPDLLALDGGRYGSAHGFTVTVPTGERARLCSYAINIGTGTGNTTLACLDLVRPVTPTGTLDEVTRTSPTTATVRGWALDPDTAAPVDVHVYTDGRLVAVSTATGARGDIAAAYPGWGAAHGYSLTVPATPGQRVCSYAINTLQGSDNTTLGCRTA